MSRDLLAKARTALGSASLLLEAGDTDGATNRAYYAMHDAAIAALAWADAGAPAGPPKTHSGLIAAFGLRVVRPGLMDPAFGRSLNQVQELRLTGDYVAAALSYDDAAAAVGDATLFVAAVSRLIEAQCA
jgi:hypothetical protein